MSVSMHITGTKEIAAALARLPAEFQRTAEFAALKGGMKPVLDKARGYVPLGPTGQLKKAIGITVRKVRSGKNRGQLTARVGARRGFAIEHKGKRVDPANYSHLVELGTSHSAAKPFIRPAIESSGSEIITGMVSGYQKGFSRIVKKIRK